MDPENDKKQMIEESDRLSSLPDDLIHKILSFNGTKDVIKTSCLSRRWRFIWTTMPCLTFSDEHYTISKFSEVVKHVLSGRDNQREVTSARLSLHRNDSQEFVKRILDYAFSHNVQQLNVTCFYESDVQFPLSLVSSQSLKHLTLKANWYYMSRYDHRGSLTLTSKWEVPALTTLHLDGITLSHVNLYNFHGLISECVKLKNLTLRFCEMMESNFDICHPQLSKLNIENLKGNVKVLRVVAPQLRNLNIRKFSGEILVSAPDLAHLNIECYRSLNLSADDFHSLETVDISISYPNEEDPQEIFGLLKLLHSVKFLTLNMEILEILSLSVELLSHQHSPFSNLKHLKIYPLDIMKKVDWAIEVKNFLLDNSPNATFVMVSREDILTEIIAKQAKRHMADLRVLLEEEMAHTNSCRAGLELQIERGKEKIDDILDKLRTIKGCMSRLPALPRAEMQSRFSCLCAEANVATSKITGCIKTQIDEYQSRVNARFHEFATPW